MVKSIFQQDAKLTGEEIRTLLEDRFPGVCKDLADTSIETKINLIGLGLKDLLHDKRFDRSAYECIFSAVVPSSASHRRWVQKIEDPYERLNAFKSSYEK